VPDFRVGYDDIFNNIPAKHGFERAVQPDHDSDPRVSLQPGKFLYAIGYDQNVPLVKFNADKDART